MSAINYSRVTFKDYPDTTTPITAENLNKIDKGVYDLDQYITGLDVSSPSASGTTTSFIDTVSQADGKITATKKTVSTVSTSGAGLAPKVTDTSKYLKGDGTWATPTDTNNAVTQTATSTNANYEVLFSATADNTTRTEGARKYSNLKFNPSTGNLQATQLNGVTIGSSPKFTDTNTWRGIQNNTTSTSTTDSLSANQGYIIANDVPWYATCSTAAGTAAKVATTNDTKHALVTGTKVSVKFTYDNTASAPTLNVDSKGAKSIKAYGTTAPTIWWLAGDVVNFVYDGTNWIMLASGGQISQLNNDLADSGWQTLNSTYNAKYRKVGKVVSLVVNTGTTAVPNAASTSLGTLPAGYRPDVTCSTACIFGPASNIHGSLGVSTTGDVTFGQLSGTTQQYGLGCITFLVG